MKYHFFHRFMFDLFQLVLCKYAQFNKNLVCVNQFWTKMGHFSTRWLNSFLENLGKYHFFRQLWLVLGVKLLEINSNWFSRLILFSCHNPDD